MGLLKTVGVIGTALVIAFSLGITVIDLFQFGLTLIALIIYFSFSSVAWITAYSRDVGKVGYVFTAIITLPFFVTVKFMSYFGLMDKLADVMNDKAKKFGFPTLETLEAKYEIDE